MWGTRREKNTPVRSLMPESRQDVTAPVVNRERREQSLRVQTGLRLGGEGGRGHGR